MENDRVPDNLDIYAISTSYDPSRGNPRPAGSMWRTTKVSSCATASPNSAFVTLGGSGFPYAVYVDANNNIVARSSGGLEPAAIEATWQIASSS